jgi:ATP dependent DNA ligase domain
MGPEHHRAGRRHGPTHRCRGPKTPTTAGATAWTRTLCSQGRPWRADHPCMRVRGGSGAAPGPVPPAGLRPMHPTAARELPADQRGWAFEPKWDGYRALGHVVGGRLALRSMAGWFPELAGLAGALGDRAGVLDGAVVAMDDNGRPNFGALQQRMAARGGRRRGPAVTYLVFDVLWLDGRLLTGLPHVERRRLLEDLEVAGPRWQTVASFPGAGTALLAATLEQGLEGVVAKKLRSSRASTCPGGAPGTGSRPSTTSARRSWSAGSSPTATRTRSGPCWSASPIRAGRVG